MSARARACLLVAFATAVGCNPAASSCDRSVAPAEGDDTAAVQAMFVAAMDGETLCFAPGAYQLSASIEIRDRTGVTIRGDGATPNDVVLAFASMTAGAKGISATAMTDVTIENMSVLDAASDDVYVTGSTGVVMRNLRAGWVTRTGDLAGAYALYPVSSSNVLVEGCETFGSPDAGVYVGQVTNCIVRGNHSHHNVAGIEIENSTNCEVMDNEVENNTGGILVFELASLPERGHRTSVHDNRICTQDVANFCHDGTTVCAVPDGIGIMLMGANEVEVHHNEICENGSTGILAISYMTAVATGDFPAPTDPTYDAALDEICLHDNTFMGNGMAPDGPLQVVAAASSLTTLEDIIWDGMDPVAALTLDATGSFRNGDVPGDFMNQSTDKTPHLGTCTPIPPVEL